MKPSLRMLLVFCLFSIGPLVAPATHAAQEPASRGTLQNEHDSAFTSSGPSPGEVPEVVAPSYLTLTRAVFQSNRDGNWEIYTAIGDGTAQTRLTNHPASDIKPRLSRLADRIAFASNRDGNYEIYVINVDGSGLLRLTVDGADDTDPTWSPDDARIAFSSTRDGQAEIYVMNADGSGLSRLTNEPEADTRPDWSPDGAQIAFASTRAPFQGSGGRIWVMDTNGANAHAVSSANNSNNPIWAPDGTDLIFDGDFRNHYWQINHGLMRVRRDGAGQYGLIESEGIAESPWWTSLSAGAWLENGDLFAYTDNVFGVAYGSYGAGGRWYAGFASASSIDLQPLDLTPPSTTVQALPPVAPAQITVTWTGSADDGPAHAFRYEVQTRETPSGTWTLWANATHSEPAARAFRGLAGQTYFFRSRGIDAFGNIEAWPVDADAWTTIESLPPQSSLQATPRLGRDTPIALAWEGADPGGSGIEHYDLEYRVGMDGAWTRLLTATRATTATFDIETGTTVFFRVRATDAAGNVEAWSSAGGNAVTTRYSARVDGRVYDAAGAPVHAAAISLTAGQAYSPSISDAEGRYSVIVISAGVTAALAVEKAGYGDAPAAVLPISINIKADYFLPPIDNTVANWGFESPLTGTAWLSDGVGPLRAAETSAHTGLRGLDLGGLRLAPPANVSRSATDSFNPSLAVDADGIIHALWIERAGSFLEVRYSARQINGQWSSPAAILGGYSPPGEEPPADYRPEVATDASGGAHAVWRGWPAGNIYYAVRPAGADWTVYLVASSVDVDSAPMLAVHAGGTAHLAWHNSNGARQDVFHAQRGPDGVWSAIENVTGSNPYLSGARAPAISVDVTGTTFLAWEDGVGFVATRSVAGGWSTPAAAFSWPFQMSRSRLRIDAAGVASVAWQARTAAGVHALVYAEYRNAALSQPVVVVAGSLPMTIEQVVVDMEGRPHVVFSRADGRVFDGSGGAGGEWTIAELPAPSGSWSDAPQMAATPGGLWAAWRVKPLGGEWIVACAGRNAAGEWMAFGRCADTVGGAPFLGAVGGRLHLAVASGPAGSREIWHTSWMAAQAGQWSVAQRLTLPLTLTSPGLSFVYRIDGSSADGRAAFTVTAETELSATAIFTSHETPGTDWQHIWRDMSAFAGQVITLAFAIDPQSGSGGARLALDEVSLGSTAPDLWVLGDFPSGARRGDPAYGLIRYANRGGGLAAGVLITMMLPAGMTFGAADPAPIATGPALIWQLPDAPGQTADNAIVVTVAVDLDAPSPAILTPTLMIRTASPELELANNDWMAGLFVGQRAYVPVVWAP